MPLLTFLDIECVSKEKSYDNLDARGKKLWDKFQERFVMKPWYESKEQAYKKMAALYAEWGMIVCISAGYFVQGVEELNVKTYVNLDGDETWLLTEFVQDFAKIKKGVRWCGHNIKKFDLPYISQRLVINDMPISQYPFLNRFGIKPWDNNDVDTMELWTTGVYGQNINLDRLTYALGIESPKDAGIEGSKVGECYWGEGEWSEMKFEKRMEIIGAYCERDIEVLPKVMEKFGRLV